MSHTDFHRLFQCILCILCSFSRQKSSNYFLMVFGEFIITMIFNGLVALDVPTTINDFVTGAVLLAIVTLTNRGKIGSVIK